MNIKSEDLIYESEGYRAHPYRDTRGYLTVAIGTNLDAGIPLDEAKAMVAFKVQKNRRLLLQDDRVMRMWPQLTPNMQAVCDDACYQLGVTGFLDFMPSWLLGAAGEYEMMASHLRAAPLYKQTPKRVERWIELWRKL